MEAQLTSPRKQELTSQLVSLHEDLKNMQKQRDDLDQLVQQMDPGVLRSLGMAVRGGADRVLSAMESSIQETQQQISTLEGSMRRVAQAQVRFSPFARASAALVLQSLMRLCVLLPHTSRGC